MSDFSDAQLVAQSLQGDKNALELLVARHLQSVYFFVYKYVHNVEDAEDLTQEVFIKVWKNLKKFDQNKNFKTWILRIAHNTALDYLRKKKNIPFSDFETSDGDDSFLENIVDPEPLPSEVFDRKNLAAELQQASKNLSTAQAVVINLYYQEQLTFQEIADILGESINTVKSRHLRALGVIRKNLGL